MNTNNVFTDARLGSMPGDNLMFIRWDGCSMFLCYGLCGDERDYSLPNFTLAELSHRGLDAFDKVVR